MNFITIKEAAKSWEITDRMVVYHLTVKNRLADDIRAVRQRMVKTNETNIFG